MGLPQARGFVGSQRKLHSSSLLITISRRIVITLIIAWPSGVVAALGRRGIFLGTRGAPQAPDCWGSDGEEANLATRAVGSGHGWAPVQGGLGEGTSKQDYFLS